MGVFGSLTTCILRKQPQTLDICEIGLPKKPVDSSSMVDS